MIDGPWTMTEADGMRFTRTLHHSGGDLDSAESRNNYQEDHSPLVCKRFCHFLFKNYLTIYLYIIYM